MSYRPFAGLAVAAAALCACAPLEPMGPGPGGIGPGSPYPANPAAFRAEDFAWSSQPGTSAIQGRVAYTRDGQRFHCTGSVALTPDTPYTRNRFQNLYGNIELAALPEAVIRARNVADPAADYRAFVRSERCADDQFAFSGLPDGAWYLVTPVSAGGDDRVVLMRRVETRGGRTVSVVQ